jgi:putative PIN family toxin of toxin-antitoxin system
MSIRVVLDTNITVSGLFFGGIPLKIVKAGISKEFTWVISEPLIKELERVLSSKKFGLQKNEISVLLKPILRVVEVVVPQNTIDMIKDCPGDNRVLECALEGRCKAIVTGDRKHLLALGKIKGCSIVSPKEFLETF